MKKNVKFIFLNFIMLFLGLLWLGLVITKLCLFGQPYYGNGEGKDIRFASNTVNRYAYLTYFTNITLILIAIYFILFAISNFFNLNKLNKFLHRESVVLFLTASYVITAFVSVVYDIIYPMHYLTRYLQTGFTDLLFWFLSSVIEHYLNLIVVLILFITFKPSKKIEGKKLYFFSGLYLLSYFAIVMVLGKYCYIAEWYPYPFLHPIGVWDYFVSKIYSGNYNGAIAITICIFCLIFILLIFELTIYLCHKIKTKIKNSKWRAKIK